MHQPLRRSFPTAIAALLLVAGTAAAADFETSFEGLNIIGDFTLGDSPLSVTFAGGGAFTIGNFNLYHTGVASWMVDAGDTGVVTLETPVREVMMFLRNESALVTSTLTVFDTEGGVVATIDATHVDWTEVHLILDDGMAPIANMTFENSGSTGWAVIDDFSFCQADMGDGGLDDPIPDPIPPAKVAVALEPVASGLTAPNWAISAPLEGPLGRRRLFIVDQPGQLWALDLQTGALTLFADLSNLLVPLGAFGDGTFDERGFLGLAFHPDYATNGLLYTYTSQPADQPADFPLPPGVVPDHQSVLTEWTVSDPTHAGSVVDPGSARVLLRIDQPQFNHNAGALNFGLDGHLYIALGDGGNADDEGDGHGLAGNGQNPRNVLGSILRIDPLGTDSTNGQYGIPADNPFLTRPQVPDELFAYGFRNPFRFSVDPFNGRITVADVGQNDIEEIDILRAGENYGWNLKEGSFCFDGNGDGAGFVTLCAPGQVPEGLIDPIAEYDHDEGIAIVGGFTYRGRGIAALRGLYVFGDFSRSFGAADGRLFALDPARRISELLPNGKALGLFVLGFGRDAQGEIYLLANSTGVPFDTTGVVLKLVPGS